MKKNKRKNNANESVAKNNVNRTLKCLFFFVILHELYRKKKEENDDNPTLFFF